MRKIKTTVTSKITIKNIQGFFERFVTKFGTGAKIDCPKEHLGKRVIVVVKRE